MSWTADLVFDDGKSRKFWRARVQGCELEINFGRLGTEGQTQTKVFQEASEAKAELQKQAAAKRKKGYAEATPALAAVAPREPSVVVVDERSSWSFARDTASGRMEIELRLEGSSLRTVICEPFRDAVAARDACAQVRAALSAEGYGENE